METVTAIFYIMVGMSCLILAICTGCAIVAVARSLTTDLNKVGKGSRGSFME